MEAQSTIADDDWSEPSKMPVVRMTRHQQQLFLSVVLSFWATVPANVETC